MGPPPQRARDTVRVSIEGSRFRLVRLVRHEGDEFGGLERFVDAPPPERAASSAPRWRWLAVPALVAAPILFGALTYVASFRHCGVPAVSVRRAADPADAAESNQ